MRELALVLPDDVWLTNLTGTASPAVSPRRRRQYSLRASVPGPALALVGCARSQDAVAGFVQALKDIDGVTRVGVQSSSLGGRLGAPTQDRPAVSSCQTRNFIAQFQIVGRLRRRAGGGGDVRSRSRSPESSPESEPASSEPEGEG